jgi:DNA mismatch repair ATPase MutL
LAFGRLEEKKRNSTWETPVIAKRFVTSEVKMTIKAQETLIWKNPVFEMPEKPIASVSSHEEPFKFDKTTFNKLQIIGQVDQKFIACKLVLESGTLLVLIDQHAADERIKLETYMRDYETQSCDISFPFQASCEYASLCESLAGLLRKHGLEISISKVSLVTFTGTIQVTKPLYGITQTLALDLLLKSLDYLKQDQQSISILPPILDYLKSKACR